MAVSLPFTILNPCSKRWADLPGDGRQRHCDVCQTSVYAMAQYSRDEWDEVWRESGGRVCGFLSEESPLARRSRRAVLAGALLTAISPLMAQSGRVRIRVTDGAGAVVPGAEVSLLGPDNQPTRTEKTNGAGEIVFQDLPVGDARFTIVEQGFQIRRLTVTIRNGDEVKIETTLDVGLVGEFVTVKRRSRWRWLILRRAD
jgi:hypothetical protein